MFDLVMSCFKFFYTNLHWTHGIFTFGLKHDVTFVFGDPHFLFFGD